MVVVALLITVVAFAVAALFETKAEDRDYRSHYKHHCCTFCSRAFSRNHQLQHHHQKHCKYRPHAEDYHNSIADNVVADLARYA